MGGAGHMEMDSPVENDEWFWQENAAKGQGRQLASDKAEG